MVCDENEFSTFLKCSDHFLTQEDFIIQKCNNCGFLFTNPRPFVNELGNYYKSEEYISHSNTNKGLVNSIYQKVRQFTLKKKYKLVSNFHDKGSILDIGCATGEFLNIFKENNWEVRGIEPDENARKMAVSNYDLNIGVEDDIETIESNSFDVITMWHVLEHVSHLNERISQIKRLLKNNGILVVAVPNCNSKDAKIYKEFWAAYDVPRHLYHFSQDTIKPLFEKHNFELQKIKPMKFDSYYVSLLSEKYKSGKQKYLKSVCNGFRSNLYARFNKNEYSSLIYILKNVDI